MSEKPLSIEELIDKSILKWEHIVNGTGFDLGIHDCPLCKEYHIENCIGCPIKELTGTPYCQETPYTHWCRLTRKYGSYVVRNSEMLDAATDMLNYLKGLRTWV
jgi:hypothetical protein